MEPCGPVCLCFSWEDCIVLSSLAEKMVLKFTREEPGSDFWYYLYLRCLEEATSKISKYKLPKLSNLMLFKHEIDLKIPQRLVSWKEIMGWKWEVKSAAIHCGNRKNIYCVVLLRCKCDGLQQQLKWAVFQFANNGLELGRNAVTFTLSLFFM